MGKIIDVESLVISSVLSKLRATFSNIFVSGEIVKAPASFPCVTLAEMDNNTYARSLESDLKEHHANLMYEAQIYSNKLNGKKTECRNIASALDDAMVSLGFVRTYMQPTLNLDDATIYRIVARYQGVVSEDGRIYHQ